MSRPDETPAAPGSDSAATAATSTASEPAAPLRADVFFDAELGTWPLPLPAVSVHWDLGAGHFGLVFLGRRTADAADVLVKTLPAAAPPALRCAFVAEARITLLFSAPDAAAASSSSSSQRAHVLQLLGVTAPVTRGVAWHSVWEHTPYGDVHSAVRALRNRGDHLADAEAHALAFVHACGVLLCHVALPRAELGPGNAAKWAHFRAAAVLCYETAFNTLRNKGALPLKWVVPEMPLHGEAAQRLALDVWGLGVVLWELEAASTCLYRPQRGPAEVRLAFAFAFGWLCTCANQSMSRDSFLRKCRPAGRPTRRAGVRRQWPSRQRPNSRLHHRHRRHSL